MTLSEEAPSSPPEPAPPVSKRVRILAWIGIALLILVCVALSAYAILSWRVRSARDAAVERVRAAGDPVGPEDIPRPKGTGKSPAEWLARVREMKDFFGGKAITE